MRLARIVAALTLSLGAIGLMAGADLAKADDDPAAAIVVAGWEPRAFKRGWGAVSDGTCGCKTNCYQGRHPQFSGPASQCKAFCEDRYAGCRNGEVRRPGVRRG